MTKKYLDYDGLIHYESSIKTRLNDKVDKVNGKGLSTNDLTNELKKTYDDTVTAVEGIISTGGEANVINEIKVNNVKQEPVNKVVSLTIPTDLKDLANAGTGTDDSKYATQGYVKSNGGKIDKIQVNGTDQTITDKTVNISMPTKVSDLTNDGDGTSGSKFATESYVTTNGGKIDKIKVNNVEQTITSKTVNISVPTTSDIQGVVTAYGYQTSSDVEGIVTGKGYQTASDVQGIVTGYGYQTASDVSGAISTAISSTYKASGSIAFASLPSLSASNLGNVYNINDDFTTTADFVEGAGKAHKAGSNVAIVKIGENYKYDVMAGFIDLSSYADTAITNEEINGIVNPTQE